MNQLERDLLRQSRQRLRQWVLDVFDLFEMADLDQRAAAAAILTDLMSESAKVIAGLRLDEFDMASRLILAVQETRTSMEKDPDYRKWKRKRRA